MALSYPVARKTAEHAGEQGANAPVSMADAALKSGKRQSRKAALLADATRQFCNIDRPTRHDIEVFRELFYQLIESTGKADRRKLAATLSRSIYCPRTLLIFLAMDDPDVAAPILLFSPAINEADILTLSRRLSLEHLKILSRRIDLTEAAARALAKAGGVECGEILARNPGLAPERKPQSARAVASIRSEEIHESTFVRRAPAEPPAHGQTDAAAPVATAKPALAAEQRLREEIVDLAGRGGRLGARDPASQPERAINPDSSARGRRTTNAEREKLLLDSARKGLEPLANTVHEICGIREATVARILRSGGADTLCVIFKGLGVGFVATLQLLLLLDKNVGKSRSNYENAKKLVARLDSRECRDFLVRLGGRPIDEADRRAPSRPATDWGAVIARRREALAAERGTESEHKRKAPNLAKTA